MEKLLIIYKRRWFILLALILAGGIVYFTIPLLYATFYASYKFMLWVSSIISALPQLIWWQLGVIFLIFAALTILKNLKKSIFPGNERGRELRANLNKQGRLWEIWQMFRRAEASKYYQDEIKNILQRLIIEYMSLQKEISAEEAREKFHQGDWTEDKLLKNFFAEPILMKEKRSLWSMFKKPKSYSFSTEVEKVLDKLASANILIIERENGNGNYDR